MMGRAAKILGISRRELLDEIEDTPGLKAALEWQEAWYLITAKEAEWRAVLNDKTGAASRRYLSRYGRDRGYGPARREIKLDATRLMTAAEWERCKPATCPEGLNALLAQISSLPSSPRWT